MQARWNLAGGQAIKGLVMLLAIVPCMRLGDFIHLAIFYPYYLSAVGLHQEPLKFDWGDSALFVTDGLQAHTLVYNPTGASDKNVGVLERSPSSGLMIYTRHLVGPFFIEDESSD